jgi:hypothetical protein
VETGESGIEERLMEKERKGMKDKPEGSLGDRGSSVGGIKK